MCGLAGLFAAHSDSEIDAALLRRMTAALAHRGPDGDGFHVEPGIGLGHRRLAIIDIAGGHQPMFNEDGSVVIVFNGQIYNFQELMPELQALGHTFRSRCDTEVIVHAWESWGPDCLARMVGMFAFAIWDRHRRQVFIARDRLGKKPLYWAELPRGGVAFASEMAAMAEIPGLAGRIAPRAVEDFFTWGYIPDPDTIYEGVHRLPPAHFMLLEHGNAPVVRRYWQPPTQLHPMAEPDAVAELTRRLEDCTARRLVSDVPLGAFLSGGVDSSGIVATAARLRGERKLDTFTIGFDGAEDETPYATMVATRYGTVQHNERAAAVDIIEAARAQGRIFGEPFGDQSAVPTHSVCRLARRHATVAVSGDGGDEVFAGYRRYQWHKLVEGVRAYIPGPLRRHAIGTLAAAYPKLDRAPRWLRFKHTLSELSLDSTLGYLRTVTRVHADSRRALFAPGLRARLDGYDPTRRIAALMEECPSDDALLQAQYVDLATWLAGGILVKVDRASMANSLEVRAPMLDHRFVEWGIALQPALKLRNGSGKYVLKKALEPYVPHAVMYRPKQGFATALGPLFRRESGRLRARLLGAPMLDAGLFSAEALARMLEEHEQGSFDHSLALWHLLVFEGFLVHAAAAAPPGIALAA